MGCFIALVAMLSPRAAFVLVWLFTDRVDIAYPNAFVPLLGLIFLPWTALMYTLCYAAVRGVSGLGWVFVGLAFLVDLASYGSGAREQRRRGATPASA